MNEIKITVEAKDKHVKVTTQNPGEKPSAVLLITAPPRRKPKKPRPNSKKA